MPSPTQKLGRPTKLTKAVVTKLVQAFELGCNDTEACAYSGISRNTYYRWTEEDTEFSDKIKSAKVHVLLRAKMNVADAINRGDLKTSQWYLERKAREEFGIAPRGIKEVEQPQSGKDYSSPEVLNDIVERADTIAEYLQKRDEIAAWRNGAKVRGNDDDIPHEGY
jgi:hypothetical protein